VTEAQLFEGAALADGLGPALRKPVSVLVADGILAGIFDGPAPASARAGARISTRAARPSCRPWWTATAT
jgi:hypothetical protein